ncbi:cysteine--tRNA ligase [Candidatus Kuenenbacteria bacterium]|nr:cysteine--tRNA ligase [Candidatus Kuenenbacteria bacterium]
MRNVNIYNTLGREKQKFQPLKKGRVLMYHCGPTVYWTQHIGNMRGMVTADLIVRGLEYLGYKVKLTRNYTDVGHLTSDADEGEDKMEKASRRDNLEPDKIAKKYIEIFEQDIKELNTRPANYKPRATSVVPEVVQMVKTLLKNGYAYETDLAVYFDISKAKKYTQLSGQKMEENIKDAGKGEVSDPGKKNAADFALWFFRAGKHQNALQYWKSPFKSKLVKKGEGFPGWHIECSVMCKKFLGETIDIHMGGVEHIPVHHTNEIAQSEAANGVKFVNYWLHNEHLMVNNKKMAKSEGTGYALSEVKERGFEPMALRYFFLQAHYRSKQNFTWEGLEASKVAYQKLKDFMAAGEKGKSQAPNPKSLPHRQADKINHKSQIQKYRQQFITYISDDFNIPAALSVVWEIMKDDSLPYPDKKKLILDFDKVLGLRLDKIKKEKITVPEEVQSLVAERDKARKNKDWTKADELRKKIDGLGFVVEDADGKSVVKKK